MRKELSAVLQLRERLHMSPGLLHTGCGVFKLRTAIDSDLSAGKSCSKFVGQDSPIAATQYNAGPYYYFVGADEALSVLPLLTTEFDEPCGNSSTIPIYFVSALRRKPASRSCLSAWSLRAI
jgi:hypothetical protein